MEIPGLDPGITICKIAVLPIKLYPLASKIIIIIIIIIIYILSYRLS